MHRTAELERLARVARQQAVMASDPAAAEALQEMAQRFAKEARDRRMKLGLLQEDIPS
jgi:hypothetical protein